ncbi:SH3 domain-containing protein [Paenibacillus apiarius]|uniref:SH3 domain-containing protein n=1 Tax=Paenibacillus apiarius TaxID=46240 RepID=A0ABT4DY74_9BACL|nr:SH3 domain-containing protein [Paenibacillus apiarius]MCY9517836.1 SH3 domain-containing protein [Paenibacillus apiarius]MCY9522310.1 SH3 domain-containing protein [Paenibacillus apiarius]MCY9555089.1 SH3 domain-containing protein [Paenibacillus apiarius]MCY9558221.1 SH3 domain-containing protein [Paenibacillus apiarius]MCY9684621.1 SH3 domain-containing protein [Paenibacillus apiarius]
MFKKFASFSLAIASMVFLTQGAYAAENNIHSNVNTQHHTQTVNDEVIIQSITYVITEDGVRFRSNPSLSGAVLGLLYKGDMVNTGHSEPIYADGYAWKSVYSYKHNTWGWVVADYLAER